MEEMMIIVAVLAIAGLFAGFAAGLFGIGGGTVLVPVFLTIFPLLGLHHELMMHIAVSTSLALIIPTAISSSYKHYKLGHMDPRMIKKWLPGLIIGIISSAIIIHSIPTYFLKVFFTVYLLFCFVFSVSKSEENTVSELGPGKGASGIASFFVGGLSTLLGSGGGTFTVPILMYFHYPLKKAIGVSAITGLFIGTIGTIIIMMGSYNVADLPKYSIGYVNILAFIAVTPTAVLASSLGARFVARLTKHQLNISYILFLLFMFLVMLYHLGIYP